MPWYQRNKWYRYKGDDYYYRFKGAKGNQLQWGKLPLPNARATAKLASSNRARIQYVKKLLNVEFKNFELDNSQTMTAGGTITHLTGINQGDTATSRDGNSARLRSMIFRFTITKDAADTSESTVCRRIIFKMGHHADTPTVTEILDSASVNSMFNLDNTERFTILSDSTFRLADGIMQVHQGKKRFKFNHKIKWTGSLGTNVQYGQIYMLTISNESTYPPTHSMLGRVRFVDN